MKLRAILLVLAIFSLVSAGAGGFFLYSRLANTAWEVATDHTDRTASTVRKQVTFYLEQHRKTSLALSKIPQLATAFNRRDEAALADANALLDHQCASLEAAVCYLMDAGGTTIASSNRDTPVSFVGKNYGFRPYFKEAIAGRPAVYLALGVTSKKRGLYFSAPVITSPGEFGGVVVVKYSLDKLESEFSTLAGIFALTDPKGMVFASNRKPWIFRSLSTLSDKEAEAIVKSRQFGEDKPSSVGLIETKDARAIAPDGTNYLISKEMLPLPAGWHVAYLFDTANISTQLKFGFGRVPVESMFAVLFLIVAVIVIFLYRKAAGEIVIRNQAVAALRESENRLLEAQRIAHLGNWRWDIVDDTLWWSEEIFHIFGVEPRSFDATYRAFLEFVHPDDREMVESAVKNALDDKAPYSIEHRIVLASGEIRYVHEQGEVTYGESDEPVRMDGIVLDATERKRAEEALHESQARYQGIVEDQSEFISRFTPDGTRTYINRAYAEFLGGTADELSNADLYGVVHEDHRDALKAIVAGFTPENSREEHEQLTLSSDGEYRWVQWTDRAIFDDQGRVVEIQAVGRDITERKQAEEAMKVSQARLSGILRIAPDAVISVGTDMNIQLFNQGAEQIFGYTAEEVLGRSLEILMPEYIRKHHRIRVNEFDRSGETYRLIDRRQDVLGLRKDGTEFPASASVTKLDIHGEKIFTVMLQDITERKRTEEALRESEGVLNSIIENVPVGLLIKDQNHVVERANRTYLNWYGFDADNMLNLRSDQIEDFQTAEEAAPMNAQEREVLTTGLTQSR